MILVVGGTIDGRKIAAEIASRGKKVLVSTATQLGASLAAGGGIEVIEGRLDDRGLERLIRDRVINVVVDASHPFAVEITQNAIKACQRAGVRYIRYARPEENINFTNSPVRVAEGFEEAAVMACGAGKTVFLTTGSKTAGIFLRAASGADCRVLVRVSPDPEVIRGLLAEGFSRRDIVAMVGPFGEELNIALFKQYRADVIVAKESGAAGGLREKLSAAEKLGLPVIIVRRPPEPPGAVYSGEEAVNRALRHMEREST
ncbi:MAG: precorrin-6A reductase [Bacillota bacterium]